MHTEQLLHFTLMLYLCYKVEKYLNLNNFEKN